MNQNVKIIDENQNNSFFKKAKTLDKKKEDKTTVGLQ